MRNSRAPMKSRVADIAIWIVSGVVVLTLLIVLSYGVMWLNDEYNNDRGKGDAPISDVSDEEVFVMNFPDGFANIAFKCHGPNGVYTHTREAAPIVIKDDANCPQVNETD